LRLVEEWLLFFFFFEERLLDCLEEQSTVDSWERLFCRLVGRLPGCSEEQLSDRLAGQLTGRLGERLSYRLVGRLADRLGEQLSDRLVERLPSRLEELLLDRFGQLPLAWAGGWLPCHLEHPEDSGSVFSSSSPSTTTSGSPVAAAGTFSVSVGRMVPFLSRSSLRWLEYCTS
jgi:hypothetical protein